MQKQILLEHIDWSIDCKPSLVTKKDTDAKLTKEEWDAIIFTESTTICFLMDDHCTFFVDRVIQGPATLKQVLTFIYRFYQEPMSESIMPQVFQGRDDFYEEIKFYAQQNEEDIKNVDAFDDYCGLPFLGLQFDPETNKYEVLIGPE